MCPNPDAASYCPNPVSDIHCIYQERLGKGPEASFTIRRREAVYNSNLPRDLAARPWKTFGDGPVTATPSSTRRADATLLRSKCASQPRVTPYAFVMGWHDKEALTKRLVMPEEKPCD